MIKHFFNSFILFCTIYRVIARGILAYTTKTIAKTEVTHRVLAVVLAIFVPVFGYIYLYTPTLAPVANATTNNTINFQARLLTNTGALIPDGNYHIEFKIYDSASAGSSAQGTCSGNSSTDDCWWRETRTTGNLVTVKNGNITANLGSVTAFPASMPWDQELWLAMNIGGNGGSASWDGEMSPRMKITSVPFSQSSKTSQQLKVTSGANSTTLSIDTPTAINTINLPNASGTIAVSASGNIALNATTGNITLTGQVPIVNGGTGANTQQSAINALSGMSSNGDLLYYNGTNSVPLARGTDGQRLLSNTSTIIWGTCTGSGSGVSTVGALDGGTANANGATISGHNIYLQSAYTSSTGGTTPEIKLDSVRGGFNIQDADISITGNLLAVLDSNASGLGNTLFSVDSTGQALFQNNSDSITALQVLEADSDNVVFSVDTANERVGVGEASPADKLDINGDIRIGTSGANGCIKDNSGGTITGTCSSDEAFKENIFSLENALDKVTQLQAVTFNYNDIGQ